MKDQLEALILQMYKSNILYSEAVREFKKRFIVTVLEENRGNQCKAARELGMHRNTLSRTMQELKIDVRPLRVGAKRPPRSARPGGAARPETDPLASAKIESGMQIKQGRPKRAALIFEPNENCRNAIYCAGFLCTGDAFFGAAFTSMAPSSMVMTNGFGV